MSATAVGIRPRASLVLRLIHGRRAAAVAVSPAALGRGLRGWFTGARLVLDADGCVRAERSPWPLIAVRVALLVVLLGVAVACGCWRAALVASCGYMVGVLDARLR